jgi:outer membrane protein
MTGASDSSEPEGYKVYSAFAMEMDISRRLTDRLALALPIATESREVELAGPAGKENLGSIELLPVNLIVQFRPRPGGRFHPYVGAGLSVIPFWEKSGKLDSTDLTLGVGPTFQVGFDYDISRRAAFTAEFRATRLTTDLQAAGATVATLSLHPSTLGAGVRFRF